MPPRTILVVDDDPVFASSIQMAARAISDLNVHVAIDCPSALLLLGERPYPVVVLDLDLGSHGSGLEVLGWLRKHAPQTILIVVSAHFTDYLMELLSLFHAVKATFTKPVNVNVVARVLASYVAEGELQSALGPVEVV
ncbi:MAG: response regulator [Acidobacteriota bacterium]